MTAARGMRVALRIVAPDGIVAGKKTHSGGTHALDDRHHPAHPLAPRCLRGQHWWNSPPPPGDRAHRDRLPSRDGAETGGLTPSKAQGRPNRPPFFFVLQDLRKISAG